MANANRTVSVKFRADASTYITSMRSATTATNRLAQAATAAAQAGQHMHAVFAQAGHQVASTALTHANALQQGTHLTTQAVAGWQSQIQSGAAATSHAIASGVGTWQTQLSGGASAVGRAVAGWQSQVTSQSAATAHSMTSVMGAWSQGVAAGASSTSHALASASTAASSAAHAVTSSARESREAWTTAGTGIAASGAAMAAGFLAAAHATLDFDRQMSAAKAALEPTGVEFAQLRQAALAAGQATRYSASEAASAITALGKAGVSTADILNGGLSGALALAASDNVDLTEAAETAANAMAVFGLKGKDVGHIADLLAAAAAKTTTNVHDLSFAFRMAGTVSAQTGLSIEETTTALAELAKDALTGSDAGTSLKTMLMALNPKSVEAASLMKQLGFSAYDATGNFVGLEELARRMQQAFGNLTPEARASAMATIFGSDAVRAASIIYKNGAEGVRYWMQQVNDSGYASRTAATQTDNLSGDLKRLSGAFETAFIQSGSAATEVLRKLAQALTAVVNWYSNLDPILQTGIVLFTAVAAVVGLFAGALLLVVPRIAAMRAAMQELAVTAPLTAGALRGLQIGLGIVGAGLALATVATSLFGGAKHKATVDVQQFTDSIKQDNNALGENTKKLAAQELESRGAFAAAQRLGISVKDLTDAATGNKAALDRVNAVLEQLRPQLDNNTARLGRMGKDTQQASIAFDVLQGALKDVSDAAAAGKDSQDRLSVATQDQTDKAKEQGDQALTTADDLKSQKSAVDVLKDALDRLNGVHVAAEQDAIQFQSAIADLTKSVKDHGTSLDINTEKGRANMSAFLDAARAANEHAQSVTNETGSVADGNKVLQGHIDQLRGVLRQMGFNEGKIDDLIATYLRVPTGIDTVVNTDTGKAIGNIGRLKGELDAIPRTVNVGVKVSSVGSGWWRTDIAEADGGVLMPRSVSHFRDGAHVAQIAPAGSWRVWAEEETGGEAYIPLASSKRNRSMAILSDVADRFGADVVPRGKLMPARALVGTAGPGSAAGAASGGNHFNIANYYAGDQSASDVATELWWQARARG